MIAKLGSEVGMLREAVERISTYSHPGAGGLGGDQSVPTLPAVTKNLRLQLRSTARALVSQSLLLGNYSGRQQNREQGNWPTNFVKVVDAFEDESMGGNPELMRHLLPGQGYLGMEPPYSASNVRLSPYPCVCIAHITAPTSSRCTC